MAGIKSVRAKGAKSAPEAPAGYTDDDLKDLVPDGLGALFVSSKLHDKALAVAGLGAPQDWDGDMPELPNDVSTLDHNALSDLLAQFTNAMSTALWQASTHYVRADAYEEIADYLENQALLHSEQTNDTKRKAEARTDAAYVAAKALYKESYHGFVRHRDLARTLDKRAGVVSRVGGFVGDEAAAEEVTAAKASTRGKALGRSRGDSRGGTRRLAKR